MSQHAKDIFLSAVLDRPVISRSGREVGRLFDVAMSPGDPLPVVHHVLVKSARSMRREAATCCCVSAWAEKLEVLLNIGMNNDQHCQKPR